VGTTLRGIGPAYEDKIARRGLRLVDMLDIDRFSRKLDDILEYHNFILTNYHKEQPVEKKDVLEIADLARGRIAPLIEDIPALLEGFRQDKANIVFEGAQGALLDIDHGTYPFVTSSNTTAGGVASGSGFGPRYLDTIIGVTKAYCTRVGAGPFPTELSDDIGAFLAKKGHEFGSTTGRPRRCGWFDACQLRRVVFINSMSGLAITKLDVLDGLEEVKICIGYRVDGQQLDVAPVDSEVFSSCEPIYETLPGWSQTTVGIRDYEKLPVNAKKYLERLTELVGVKLVLISTGADRKDTIILEDIF